MIAEDSLWRDKTMWKQMSVGLGLVALLGIGMYFGIVKPNEDHWNKVIADDEQKTKAEHDKLVQMDCKQLGDWLLQDNWGDRDNLRWAQNHYLVNCK